MNIPSSEQIDAFINALQLSISSKILGNPKYDYDPKNNGLSFILDKSEKDTKLETFQKLISDQFLLYKRNKFGVPIMIINLSDKQISELTSFLLLTRLEPNQIEFFANKKDTSFTFLKNYRKEAKPEKNVEVKTIADAADYIFSKISEKQMTLRELSELTGMTPASLHNLKNHQDIKLSTLIKMAKALGIVIRLE